MDLVTLVKVLGLVICSLSLSFSFVTDFSFVKYIGLSLPSLPAGTTPSRAGESIEIAS